MSLRPPQFLSTSPRFETGVSVLEAELMSERASTLGRLGRAAERAIAALRDHPSDGADPAARAVLLKSAADAVWCYFVQREVIGLRDHRAVIADYAIPREVLVRLGVVEPRRAP